MLETLRQDLRYALRHLRRSPGFAVSAILILALGIGANTGMFSILNGMLLRPLPIADPDSLVGVSSYTVDGTRRQFLVPIVDLLEKNGPFETLCGINGGGIFAVEANGIPAQTSIAVVTGSCFDVFGVRPMWGRTIRSDDAPTDGKGSLVAVIGHRFWMRAFNGDPAAVGKTIRSEGVELTIIGVMPPGFVGLQADAGTDFYVPNYSVTPRRPERPASIPQLIGRLKNGVTLASAQAELTARWPALVDAVTPSALSAAERATFTQHLPRVEPAGRGLSFYRDRYGRSIQIILGLTSVLMLLVCINLGGLLLTRLNARSAELSVRLALGSTGRRLAQQMLLESLVLSLAGALFGIPLSFAFVRLLASFFRIHWSTTPWISPPTAGCC
jgi:predicted permease